MSTRPTVLVLRALGLGDFLTGLPALAVLRSALPAHEIVLAAPLGFAGLARLTGSVDRMVAAYELEPIVDPPQRPDLAVDLHGNGPASRRLLEVTDPQRLLAFGRGPVWRPDEHEVARWCRLVVEGLPAADVVPPRVVGSLPRPPGVAMPEGRTVVHCGAKAEARRWPADRFAAVAARLGADGHDVVVTGGPGEAALAESIARRASVDAAHDLSLEELCGLVAGARLVVCGDTGVAHLATNYAVPSVVLFGPVSPAVWGPPEVPRHQVLWRGDGSGDPHADRTDPALLGITVEDVMRASHVALAHGRHEGALA